MAWPKIPRTNPFVQHGRHGVLLEATRCDLMGVNILHVPQGLSNDLLAEDVAQIIGFWTVNIFRDMENLISHGWPGFDCVRFTTVIKT
jgi:hypothetical protein